MKKQFLTFLRSEKENHDQKIIKNLVTVEMIKFY